MATAATMPPPEVIITYAPSMQPLAAKTHHLSFTPLISLHTAVLITFSITAMIQTTSIYKYIKSMLAVGLRSDHWDKLIPICLNWHYNLSSANWTVNYLGSIAILDSGPQGK